MATYFQYHVDYICDAASMQNWFQNNFSNYHNKRLYEKTL